ncbi:MAG: hypothetical protein KKB37_13925 [Alphaproteobacteria bacterium]|nr:hypothetical protein [Alphaproteobacteria bacterium]
MAANKAEPGRQAINAQNDPAEVSDDITRIVNYLNAKRSDTSQRTNGLMHELSHRREEIVDRLGLGQHARLRDELSELARELPKELPRELPRERKSPDAGRTSGSPLIAERYHAFCRELDQMLDSFKARIESDKPIQH